MASKHMPEGGTCVHLVALGVGALVVGRAVVGGVGGTNTVGTCVGLPLSHEGSSMHTLFCHMQPCQLVHEVSLFCDPQPLVGLAQICCCAIAGAAAGLCVGDLVCASTEEAASTATAAARIIDETRIFFFLLSCLLCSVSAARARVRWRRGREGDRK